MLVMSVVRTLTCCPQLLNCTSDVSLPDVTVGCFFKKNKARKKKKDLLMSIPPQEQPESWRTSERREHGPLLWRKAVNDSQSSTSSLRFSVMTDLEFGPFLGGGKEKEKSRESLQRSLRGRLTLLKCQQGCPRRTPRLHCRLSPQPGSLSNLSWLNVASVRMYRAPACLLKRCDGIRKRNEERGQENRGAGWRSLNFSI